MPSLVVSAAAAAAIRRLAPHLGLVDRPGHRKVHTTPTPLGGGLAIWLGIVLPFAAGHLVLANATETGPGVFVLPGGWTLPPLVAKHVGGLQQQAPRLWFLLACATALVALGLIDDRRGLDWRLRLATQALVAAVLVGWWEGWRLSLFLQSVWLTGLLSVIWIVGLVNSFNMLDNMDGLSAGVAAIAAAMLAAVLLTTPSPITHQPQLFVSGFLLVLVGSLLGFLWHNRPPAKLFMGDAGSYFIGFCLATATSMATFTGGDLPPHTILAPLCILAVPLYDTVTVVWIRLRQRRSPFEGDKSHFSHRLVEMGMTKGQAVLTIYLTTATCGLGGLLLHQVDEGGAWIVVLLVVCVLTLIAILETTGRKRQRDE
ncbi:MAG TPA: MraY family glycosyltransferase [Pirellulales bacterium]|nr:MraY family glycosyltransferase [Pirellulales bacterium]